MKLYTILKCRRKSRSTPPGPAGVTLVLLGTFLLFIFPSALQNYSVSLQKEKLAFLLGCIVYTLPEGTPSNVPECGSHPPGLTATFPLAHILSGEIS